MKRTADVVVIGAGVIGCSTAYHLAQMGVSDVIVLEMGEVGGGSSGKSASILSLQLFADEPRIPMARYSYERYMQFEEEIGVTIDFRRIGRLAVATEDSAEGLLARSELLRSLGLRISDVSPQEIKRRYPQINVDDIHCAVWSDYTGTVDPHSIMYGFMRRAREQGAVLCEGTRATGVAMSDGRVRGVKTSEGCIATSTVVNAAGPWAGEVGDWVGVSIPVLKRARTVLVTGPFPDLPSEWPFVKDEEMQWYCRREGPGVLMGMGTVPVDAPDVPFQTDMVDEIIDTAVHRVPVLERARLLTGWTGIRPVTPDDQPILGPVDGVEGLVLNCGWGGEGIIQAPAAGQLAAECVVDGRATTFDIRPFGVGRFDRVV